MAKPEADEVAREEGGDDGAFAQAAEVAVVVEGDGDGQEDACDVESYLGEAEVEVEFLGDGLYGAFAGEDDEVGDDEEGDADGGDEACCDKKCKSHQVGVDEKVTQEDGAQVDVDAK